LNTRINGLSVDLNEIALSNSAGELDFLVDSQSSGMNGLAKSESGTGSKAKLIQNSKRYEIIKVNVNTLDHEFLNKEIEEKDTLYVLKIDTEGAEGEVVEGAMSTLQKQNKYVVICEMHLDNANLVNQMSTLIKAEIERNKIVKLYLLRFEKEPILLDHTDVSTWHRFGDGDIALKVGL
jgi:FkbM family methyltransferase